MFLKKLYHYSKPAFFGLIGFLVLFTFLNYKWGIVAAPIYQYGMYSKLMHSKDTQIVYRIYINNKPFNLTELSFTERDILLISPENYQKSLRVNEEVYLTMNRIFSMAGASGIMKREDPHVSQFNEWYKNLLEKKIGYPVKTAVVTRSSYIYQDSGMIQISKPENIFSFGT